MRGGINLISFFLMIFRIIGNGLAKSKLKRVLKKLEINHEFRIETADEMYFTVGKVIGPNYDDVFKKIKNRISNLKTEKFDVKGVFDINLDKFLVVVFCTDYDVTIGNNGNNNLSKFLRIFYFTIQRIPNDLKVEVCTDTFEDLNQKNLLIDFYKTIEKEIIN